MRFYGAEYNNIEQGEAENVININYASRMDEDPLKKWFA
jgi:hypothetical protein